MSSSGGSQPEVGSIKATLEAAQAGMAQDSSMHQSSPKVDAQQLEMRTQQLENLMPLLAQQLGRCEEAIRLDREAREARDLEFRHLLNDLANRVHEDTVPRSELELHKCKHDEMRESLAKARTSVFGDVTHVQEELGALGSILEGIQRDILDEQLARRQLQQWVSEQVEELDGLLRSEVAARSKAGRALDDLQDRHLRRSSASTNSSQVEEGIPPGGGCSISAEPSKDLRFSEPDCSASRRPHPPAHLAAGESSDLSVHDAFLYPAGAKEPVPEVIRQTWIDK